MDFSTALLLTESRYYNKVLHPKFWSNNEFNSKIRKKLLQIVSDFICSNNECPAVDDIQLTGSLANYNYTKHSDLDVHILIDFKTINSDTDLVKQALDGKRFIWNLRHNIVIGGHEVELYYQDTNEPHVASGLYSIKDDKWLTEPEYNPPSIDERDVLKKAAGITDSILKIREKVDGDISADEAKELYDYGRRIKSKLKVMRSEGLKREGEFSIENLAFKELRNNGSIGTLINTISDAYAKIYSEDVDQYNEIASFADLMGKKNFKQVAHRGVDRKRQTMVPDVHRITNADIVDQKVEKSKDDNFSRMLTKMEALRACNKYGVHINNLLNGQVKELGTSKTKIWYDGKNFFIKGSK